MEKIRGAIYRKLDCHHYLAAFIVVLVAFGGRCMDNLISLEFFTEQLGAVFKAWAIVIPLLILLLWAAYKMRGIFKA